MNYSYGGSDSVNSFSSSVTLGIIILHPLPDAYISITTTRQYVTENVINEMSNSESVQGTQGAQGLSMIKNLKFPCGIIVLLPSSNSI